MEGYEWELMAKQSNSPKRDGEWGGKDKEVGKKWDIWTRRFNKKHYTQQGQGFICCFHQGKKNSCLFLGVEKKAISHKPAIVTDRFSCSHLRSEITISIIQT